MFSNYDFNKLKNNDFLISVGIFLLTLIVYFITTCPTIYLGDSGEFVTNDYTLGSNHRPGYPLYTLLGRMFITFFFFIKSALVMNAMSGLFSSLALVVLYKIFREMGLSKIYSSAGVFIFVFSLSFWSRSNITKIYSLNILLISVSIYLLLIFERTRDSGYLFLLIYEFTLKRA